MSQVGSRPTVIFFRSKSIDGDLRPSSTTVIRIHVPLTEISVASVIGPVPSPSYRDVVWTHPRISDHWRRVTLSSVLTAVLLRGSGVAKRSGASLSSQLSGGGKIPAGWPGRNRTDETAEKVYPRNFSDAPND